jgi:hypothetical protein
MKDLLVGTGTQRLDPDVQALQFDATLKVGVHSERKTLRAVYAKVRVTALQSHLTLCSWRPLWERNQGSQGHRFVHRPRILVGSESKYSSSDTRQSHR